jgi:hypothetical protein
MKEFTWSLIRFFRLGALMLLIHKKSALRENGWFTSFNKKRSVERTGNPIPWWTYSFIDFLSPRLRLSFRALEFGSGSSSLWLGQRIKEVFSIEDFRSWADEIRRNATSNVTILNVDSISNFPSYIGKIPGHFEIVIIDNLGNRMDSAIHSLGFLSDDGVIIWDNTDGSDWNDINDFMKGHGFKEISFTGMTAQEVCSSRTTLFYKESNCLGI